MVIDITALDPQELVVLLVALGGLIPLFAYRRRLSRWLSLPYGFLLVGALATNLENLRWHETLNFIEHSVGNMGAGLAFLLLAIVYRRRIIARDPRRITERANESADREA